MKILANMHIVRAFKVDSTIKEKAMNMYLKIVSMAVTITLLGFTVSANADEKEGMSVLSHKMKNIKGKEIKLKDYKG